MNTDGIGVLVGVDESASARVALAWAATDAAARRVPLTIATVVDLPALTDVPLSADLVGAAELAAYRRVDAAVAAARDMAAGVRVQGRVLTGDVAAELLRVAAAADEVVVGSHGAGRFGAVLVGSVGCRVAEHATGPAVVVRARPTAGPVVVGIDTSPHSKTALEYGFGYADRHGLPLVALHVYAPDPYVHPVSPYPAPLSPYADEIAQIRAAAVRAAKHSLGPWAEKYPEVTARAEVADGRPAHHLVQASQTAGLLVVGTRGHGGLAGMLLGSVSHTVLRHAHCPVVVAR
jgi:nucleotide-binding universal stress UspA family protein